MNLLERAKRLRSGQTDAEQRLWYHLRAQRFMGMKFKRQKPIGPYIADFVCMECRLIIEADGGQHGEPYDKRRDAWFEAEGYTVLRFWNNEILGQTEAVLERIRATAIALSSDPCPETYAPKVSANLPSPARGRGVGGEGKDATRGSRESVSREPPQAFLTEVGQRRVPDRRLQPGVYNHDAELLPRHCRTEQNNNRREQARMVERRMNAGDAPR